MRAALMAALLVVLPGVVYVVGFEGLRWLAGGPPPRVLRAAGRRLRRVGSRLGGVADGMEQVGLLSRSRPEPVPTVLLVLELRRLAAEVRRIEAAGQPHPAARIQAALAAYDHVLVQLCTRAEVPTPIGLLPLDPRDRVGLEAELVASGVEW